MVIYDEPPPENPPENPDAPINPETGAPAYTRTETRESIHRFGEPPQYIRRITETRGSVILFTTNPTTLADEVGISHGASHPQIPDLVCTELEESVDTTVGNAFETVRTLVATYTLPRDAEGRPVETGGSQQFDVSPLARPDLWSFQTQGASVPAFFYWDGSTQVPLTNSAFDYLKGLTLDEAQTKVIIRGNRATFPSGTATAITNCVNQSSFLGGGPNQWKCQGIQGELRYEMVNDTSIRFWEVTVELMYRQTGWNLLIPDVGFNYIANGVKRRAYVVDPEDPQAKLPSADVVGLNGSGGLSLTGAPAILDRRVYRQVDFNSYFGSPPP